MVNYLHEIRLNAYKGKVLERMSHPSLLVVSLLRTNNLVFVPLEFVKLFEESLRRRLYLLSVMISRLVLGLFNYVQGS